MSDAIFDLEQNIMDCWKVIDDVDMVTKHFVDDPEWAGEHFSPQATDAIMNKYFAIKQLYELRFQRLWRDFEEVTREYHNYRKLAFNERESFDD
jgi:hypothetical protein